jgi:hypothetical protein
MGGASHAAMGTGADPSQTEIVSQITLDRAIPQDRKISVIQLDVECFEKQALSGAMQLIRRCKPLLILETIPEKDWFAEHIQSLGYTFRTKIADNSVFSM